MRESTLDLGPAGWDDSFGWGLPRMNAAIELADALIFFDGFETGGTECWDSTACSRGGIEMGRCPLCLALLGLLALDLMPPAAEAQNLLPNGSFPVDISGWELPTIRI